MDSFEQASEEWSKQLFKHLNLQHWSGTSKMIITLVILIMPVCFIIIGGIAYLFIIVYNKAAIYFYERKIEKLETRERQLVNDLAALSGKKTN